MKQSTTVSIGKLTLESGKELDVELAYERCGPLDAPVILVCHALTGNQYSIGNEKEPGWWSGLIGSGKYIDTNHWQVITFNVLGGCHGSTGPLSDNPVEREPYRASFPAITIRDIVHAQRKALYQLGIRKLRAVIGGSLGGMQVLEWGLLYPDDMEQLFVLASTPSLSDYGIAFNRIGIAAIEGDPNYKNGHYTFSHEVKGFEVARMAGMVTYRSPKLFSQRFQRKSQSADLYSVESYLHYQGEKLAKRFDANSYLVLLKAMNSHDIGRDRGGWMRAASTIKAHVIGIAFEHDLIYPGEEIQAFIEAVSNGIFYNVPTDFGHDGFLVEFEKWGHFIQHQLKKNIGVGTCPNR
ncbi:homoserine O-acetyltransferase [Bacillus sp. FJAT-49736]|uniref:homoserine O-acetyltransferase MetX n=1 Tax=Bacillus sp. FJAT-49736 TaxID=2833582 RepID=UPI001BC9194F|nr:homoserine O-acetyltransferase [Bacillus sp. FJAT-49736]MBS4174115.1 homoserine O-acetyltransferase [Bacillus sp. FJAT-49736]